MKHRSMLLLSAIFLFSAVAFICMHLQGKIDNALNTKWYKVVGRCKKYSIPRNLSTPLSQRLAVLEKLA